MQMLSKVVAGDADEEEAAAFRDLWHDRVQKILNVPINDELFTVKDTA